MKSDRDFLRFQVALGCCLYAPFTSAIRKSVPSFHEKGKRNKSAPCVSYLGSSKITIELSLEHLRKHIHILSHALGKCSEPRATNGHKTKALSIKILAPTSTPVWQTHARDFAKMTSEGVLACSKHSPQVMILHYAS